MTEPHRHRSTGAASQLSREEFSVREAIGGPRGVLESVLPTLLFVVLLVTTRDLRIAGGAAVLVVVIALVARLVQRQSPSSVIGGLIAAVVGALWAVRTGEGGDFYAPGLITNAIALAVVLLSIAVGRPLVGVVIGLLEPRMSDWRERPRARRVYTRATWLFAALYAAKLAVQLPLYLSGAVAALGVVKLLMGLPLFALVAYVVWLMHRRALRESTPTDRAHSSAQQPQSSVDER